MTADSVASTPDDDTLCAWIRAFLPNRYHTGTASPDEALVQILDQCGAKAILLNAEFQRLLATRAADSLIATGSPFQINDRRLICSLAPLEFRRAFLEAQRRRRAEIQLDDTETAWRLVLTLVPGDHGQPRVLVFVLEHAARHSVSPGRVRTLLDLTPSESELAAALTNGLTTRGYAESKQLSIHTVRNQLKSAYLKLDVHSQKDLAAHVLRCCSGSMTTAESSNRLS